MTAQEYAKNLQQELKKDEERRERQRLSLSFSYLNKENRKKYDRHILEYGTSLASLQAFKKALQS